MTVENCLKLLKKYKEQMENEKATTSQRKQSEQNYKMMLEHINNPQSRKFREVQEKLEVEAEQKAPEPKVKKIGKKSKG